MGTKQEQGIKAVNQEYTQYDQVKKEQTYNLAEGAAEEAFDEETQIRTCDLGQFLHGGPEGKARFAREIGEAMEGIGFVILEGHEIPASLYVEAEQKVAEFFTDTPLTDKMKYEAERFGSVNQGISPSSRPAACTPISSRAGSSAGVPSTWVKTRIIARRTSGPPEVTSCSSGKSF